MLWGKPSSIDAQSQRDGLTAAHSRAGTEWAYNDVRVNLLGLALTAVSTSRSTTCSATV